MPTDKSAHDTQIDIGDQDPFVTTSRQLDEALTRLDVAHTFQIYQGDHGNRIRERFGTQVLPFFSRVLKAE